MRNPSPLQRRTPDLFSAALGSLDAAGCWTRGSLLLGEWGAPAENECAARSKYPPAPQIFSFRLARVGRYSAGNFVCASFVKPPRGVTRLNKCHLALTELGDGRLHCRRGPVGSPSPGLFLCQGTWCPVAGGEWRQSPVSVFGPEGRVYEAIAERGPQPEGRRPRGYVEIMGSYDGYPRKENMRNERQEED